MAKRETTNREQALATVSVNLFDLMYARRKGVKVHVFDTHNKLVKYSWAKGLIYPQYCAQAEGTRSLLRLMS